MDGDDLNFLTLWAHSEPLSLLSEIIGEMTAKIFN